MSIPTIELHSVDVELGTRSVLSGVQLSLCAGEVLGLVGPSGAGKTTLLKVMNGSVPITRGMVRYGGSDLARLGRRDLRVLRSTLGFVHQDLALVPNLSVLQNVLSGRLGRLGTVEALARLIWPGRARVLEVHALLERVGIGDRLFERTDRLSGGERQRVAIARALHQEPGVLLADEPVSSVDPSRARDTLELLVGLSRERGIPLVLSLHQPNLALDLFDRLVGMRAGRIEFDLPVGEVRAERLEELYRLQSGEPLP